MIKLFRDTDIGGSLSGGPDPIPEDVRKNIDDEYHDTFAGRIKKAAAQFGYSLSLPTIQAQEERIRVLEEALKEIRDRGYTGAYMIAHEALIKSKALTLNL